MKHRVKHPTKLGSTKMSTNAPRRPLDFVLVDELEGKLLVRDVNSICGI